MTSLDDFASRKLAELDHAALRRRLIPGERRAGAVIRRDGRDFISFSCNDYLGLSQHPVVKRAAQEAVERLGAGAGASRLVTGEYPDLGLLELRLARLKRKPAALVFASGYAANIGVIPALIGRGDLILLDELAHACMHAGARLSGAEIGLFRHNDVTDLEAVLGATRGQFRHCLIATEGVFSMDGDRAPLADLSAIARRFDAWTLCDDAHGVGVLGHGAGSAGDLSADAIDLWVGTLSKALGSQGGYLCASAAVVELMRSRARSFVYSTALNPAATAAALAALTVIEAEPTRVAAPLARARQFTQAIAAQEAASAIVPVILGTAEAALHASSRLAAAGFLVVAIRPPTVPPGTARLRVAFQADHRVEDVAALAEAVAGIIRERAA